MVAGVFQQPPRSGWHTRQAVGLGATDAGPRALRTHESPRHKRRPTRATRFAGLSLFLLVWSQLPRPDTASPPGTGVPSASQASPLSPGQQLHQHPRRPHVSSIKPTGTLREVQRLSRQSLPRGPRYTRMAAGGGPCPVGHSAQSLAADDMTNTQNSRVCPDTQAPLLQLSVHALDN